MMRRLARRLMFMIMVAAVSALSMYGCGAANTAPAADEKKEEALTDEGVEEETPATEESGGSKAEEETPAAEESGDSKVEEVTPAFNPGEEDPEILKMISEMTTQEKLAQMMIVALRSDGGNSNTATEINEDYAELLSKYDFGGIILFGGNIVDPTQTVTLIRDSQEAAMKSAKGIPMFICVDQEGGMVNRVSFGTTGSGNMALTAAGDTSLTEETAKMMGDEMRALGFNMDFAPDSDVNSNPANPVIGVRSFSDDPNLVAEHVRAFIKGMDAAQISTALKHFPGHGNVGEDSHSHLPCSDFSLEEIMACDLIPFQAGIDQGTDMIMTAHIQFPQIEKGTYTSIQDGEEINLPATLSREIVTGILREQMGYNGIVITDAMVMDAIDEHFDPMDAAVMAINADVDILLCPVDLYKDAEVNTLPDMDKYMEGLLAKVEAGDIPEEELNNSVYRILKLKKERGIQAPSGQQVSEAAGLVGTSANHKREWEIAQAGMTLLKNENGALPLDKEQSVLILYPVERRGPSVDYAVSRLEKEQLLDASKVTSMCYAGLTADNAVLQQAMASADKLVVLSQATARNEEIVKMIGQAHESGKQAVLLSLNLPYDAACYEEADAVLCAYQPYGSAHDEEGNGPFNLNVAVAICTAFNQSVPSGTLPVNVPKIEVKDGVVSFLDEYLYGRGFGLKTWENTLNVNDQLASGLTGTWETASMGYEYFGTAQAEYYVRFTNSEILYGHMNGEEFVLDHADQISGITEIAAGRYRVQAVSSSGVQYTYQTSESGGDNLEYYETWKEEEFPDKYSGSSSLSRIE